jgi:hypothetical protein
MWLPTKAQVDAASRHAITIAGTAIAIFGLQAKGVSVEQVTAAIQSMGSAINSLVLVAGALAPLYALLKAGHSASPDSQIASTAAIASDPSQPQSATAQTALVKATAAIASNNILAKSGEAKQTLIAATIALPEVQTIVTDKATADAAPSESVVAAESVTITPPTK